MRTLIAVALLTMSTTTTASQLTDVYSKQQSNAALYNMDTHRYNYEKSSSFDAVYRKQQTNDKLDWNQRGTYFERR